MRVPLPKMTNSAPSGQLLEMLGAEFVEALQFQSNFSPREPTTTLCPRSFRC
jgi:hypothetical protein